MAYTGDKKREYQRNWMRKRREAAVEYLGGLCVKCGSSEELEFDHEDPSKKEFNVNSLLSRRWEVQKLELDKCQLLCNTCHLDKTVSARNTPQHGTESRYTAKGELRCRCVECREAARLAKASWRARTGKN